MLQCAVYAAVLRDRPSHVFRYKHIYSGRSYIFRCEDAAAWERDVDDARTEAKEKRHDEVMQAKFGHSTFQMTRAKMKIGMDSLTWQYLVAAVIFVAFMVDVLEVRACVGRSARKRSLCFQQDLISTYVHMFVRVNVWVGTYLGG